MKFLYFMQCGQFLKYESEQEGQIKSVNPLLQYHESLVKESARGEGIKSWFKCTYFIV